MRDDITQPRSRQRLVVLNDPHAMRINVELAQEIGFQESIVFLQLEFLVSISDHEIDGKRWTRQTYEELHEHFPWWSIATIKRIVARLHERNLILIDHFNKVGYDRTQWYAIDAEGVSILHSVAIFQNEKWNNADWQMEQLNLQNGTTQNEPTIPETTKETTDKSKGTNVPSQKPKKLKVTDSEAEAKWEALLENNPNADVLADFAEFRASQNRNGEIKLATLWRQIGDAYSKAQASSEALRFGLEEAIRREKPSIRYALAVARNYQPGEAQERSRARPRNSIAVVGAIESDYDPEEYRFND